MRTCPGAAPSGSFDSPRNLTKLYNNLAQLDGTWQQFGADEGALQWALISKAQSQNNTSPDVRSLIFT
jgi:hypothetical protein